MPELTNYDYQVSLWPPGGDCVYELPDGTEVTRDKEVPWFTWGFLGVCAGVAWLLSALWHRIRPGPKSPPSDSNRQPLHYK
jgi:hypothetical protein